LKTGIENETSDEFILQSGATQLPDAHGGHVTSGFVVDDRMSHIRLKRRSLNALYDAKSNASLLGSLA
jgi:hypothetical protein